MTTIVKAKYALDRVIKLGRVHFYKPIQIAEILYHSRMALVEINPLELDTYRNLSKKWRDAVTLRLIGNKSTSSARYQDDLFNQNAIPPNMLNLLDEENKKQNGTIENYIYFHLADRLQDVTDADKYLGQSSPQNLLSTDLFRLF